MQQNAQTDISYGELGTAKPKILDACYRLNKKKEVKWGENNKNPYFW